MERGDQLGGMALDGRRDSPAVGLDEIHGEEIGLCHMHRRHRQRRVARELAEHIGLEGEIGAGASHARLDREPPPIGEIAPVSGEPKPTGIGASATTRTPSAASSLSFTAMPPSLIR